MDGEPQRDPYKPFPTFREFVADAQFNPEAFEEFAADFATLKHDANPVVLKRAIDTATRWAAIDTGAIEGLYEIDRGFTITVAASASAIDNIHLEKGEDVQKKIKDAMAGYEYVLDVATQRREVTEVWIKELHETICASQETYRVLTSAGMQDQRLPKGEYKSQPNNPTNLGTGRIHEYAPPLDTPAEMARLVSELSSDEFRAAHSVLQAAYAHYALACVHPFGDGNGRVARALASTYLYRTPGIPLVIFVEQKDVYINTLERADDGDPSFFVAFIRDCALDAISMVSEDMRRPPRPDPAEQIQRLQAAMITPQGLPHDAMDKLAEIIIGEWRSAISKALDDLGDITPVKVNIENGRIGGGGARAGFRHTNASFIIVRGKANPPAQIDSAVSYTVHVPAAGSTTVGFVLFAQKSQLAGIALREVYPSVLPAFRYRLAVLAEDQVRGFIERVSSSALEDLRKRGYAV